MTLKACITGWGCVCKVFRTFSSLNFLGTRRRMPRLKWKVNKTGHSTEWKGMLILDSFNKYLLCATVCLARWWWASSLQKTSMFKEENNKPMNHQREEISNSELKKKKLWGQNGECLEPGSWRSLCEETTYIMTRKTRRSWNYLKPGKKNSRKRVGVAEIRQGGGRSWLVWWYRWGLITEEPNSCVNIFLSNVLANNGEVWS